MKFKTKKILISCIVVSICLSFSFFKTALAAPTSENDYQVSGETTIEDWRDSADDNQTAKDWDDAITSANPSRDDSKTAKDWDDAFTSANPSKDNSAEDMWSNMPNPSNSSSSGGGIVPKSTFGLPTGTPYGIVEKILLSLLGIFGILGIIGFVISGIMYLISAGNTEMAEKAKKGMIYSIVGIIVGLAGYIIIQTVNFFLNG